jgi:hypothetical protein
MNETALQFAIEYEDKVGKVIEVDKCIAAVKRIEEAKITSIDNIQRAVKTGKIP